MTPDKVYVSVTTKCDTTGYITPQSIIWKDGRVFPIDSVRDFRPASWAERPLEGYNRYTVMIRGEEKNLYCEPGRLGSRWFVLARCG